ncbi:MAG: PstS family phosphate ABC transporter substrate-binding protein [Cyclobacteriaceae bacterium]
MNTIAIINRIFKPYALSLFIGSILLVASCQNKPSETAEDATTLNIDGSSTVYPITADIVEKYKRNHNNYNINLSVSGTGGGFKKFCIGETHINNASREISDEEIATCKSNGIDFLRFDIAYDGVAIVVNPDNDWVDQLTVEELILIFGNDSTAFWSDIRPDWPEEEIKCYGPGEASGTFDFFKEVILKDAEFRENYVSSENDNLLVLGIEKSPYSIGFFGHSYFESNRDKLELIPIDNGNGAVLSTIENIGNGTYTPLSRPLYIYVNEAFIQDGGADFAKYYLENAMAAALSSGYVAHDEERYRAMITALDNESVSQ